MIFTRIKIDNLFSYKDTVLDLTYARKNKNSAIEGEYLETRPNFRFKRICIISGANSSGKTSFGKVLCAIQNYLVNNRSLESLRDSIYDKTSPAFVAVEFVTNETEFHTLELIFDKKEIIKLKYVSFSIPKTYGCIQCREKAESLLLSNQNTLQNSIKAESRFLLFDRKLHDAEKVAITKESFKSLDFSAGWSYLFSENHFNSTEFDCLDVSTLALILKSFDTSIATVHDIEDEGFLIKFKNGDSVLADKKGEVTGKNRLSKGTFDAIQVAEFIARVEQDKSDNLYYLDEKLAYSHSEVEQTVVNIIIQKLSRYSQFFYTTHNYDILEMNLPVHSFAFFKKNDDFTEIVLPEKTFKKNDRTLLNHVKNDVFRTLPDMSLLDELI